MSHGDIIDVIEQDILSLPINRRLDRAIELSDLLLNILNNGLAARANLDFNIIIDKENYNGDQFVEIIYWLIGQEEINYPSHRGKMGVRLPITRYHEAIISVIYGFFNIQVVKQRANIRNRRPPLCLAGGIITLQQRNQIDVNLLNNINKI